MINTGINHNLYFAQILTFSFYNEIMLTDPQHSDYPNKYSEIISQIDFFPDARRIPAENRFFLIKEYEEYVKKESDRLGKQFHKMKALEDFCNFRNIKCHTFSGYIRQYRRGGILALVPGWGHRIGKSKYNDTVLPIIREIVRPVKNWMVIYNELEEICRQRGIKNTTYSTFRRMIISNGLSNALSRLEQKDNFPENITEEDHPTEYTHKNKIQSKGESEAKTYRIKTPEYLHVVDKKKFNIAICKYALILPLLDPHLDRVERKKIRDDIISKTHHPLPGVTFKMSRTTLDSYISALKNEGFNGLINKYCFRKVVRYSDPIRVSLDIDMKDPLSCLKQLKQTIEDSPNTYPAAKEGSLKFLDFCLSMTEMTRAKYKPLKLSKPLNENEIKILRDFQAGTDKNKRDKATAILMAHDGCTMLEIATEIRRQYLTIAGWFYKFEKDGIKLIETKRDRKKHDEEKRKRKDRIIKILHHTPKDYNINKTAWIYSDIAEIYYKKYGKRLSRGSIRREIKTTNYTWKRAKRVLVSNDPNYKEKTKKVLDTLRNLGPNDAFFFIDEAGPWQVKKYGGKSLTEKDTIKIYPQFQKPKGRITFIGALDAVKNQIYWKFTETKDTKATISIIKILLSKYQNYSNLYLTWDCASWHKSLELKLFVGNQNRTPNSPNITIVPLPKRSQYLNVIESIFSGMKRAVVANSDYPSEHKMKIAIARHFFERNEYFKKNPKRVGKKIWDEQYYDLDNIESGLYKKV